VPGPDLILLDALGTLLALRPPGPRLRRELATRFGVEVTDAEAARGLGAEIAYYRAHLLEGRDATSLDCLRARCAAELRRALPAGRGLEAVGGAELIEALLACLHFDPFPEVPGVLRAARAAGRRLVVVSNWDVSLHDVLARVGLAQWLHGIVTSAEVGARKPDPAVFAAALALTGARAEDALHVGDSVEEDLAGARAAGIAAVLVRRDGTPAPPGVRAVARLDELPELGPYSG
jgi:putative hydrolase of the HAD superfamily